MTNENIKTQLNTQGSKELEQSVAKELHMADPPVEVFEQLHASGVNLSGGNADSESS